MERSQASKHLKLNRNAIHDNAFKAALLRMVTLMSITILTNDKPAP